MSTLSPKKRRLLIASAALMLILTVCLGVFFANSAVADQTPEQTPTPTAEPTATPTAAPTPTPTPMPENVTNLTEQQALDIALPVIEKYASENNRTIENVTARLSYMADYEGKRGGATFEQVTGVNLSPGQAHNQFSCYPVYSVSVAFDSRFNHGSWNMETGQAPSDAQFWITGYVVHVWADTGEVADGVVQGLS